MALTKIEKILSDDLSYNESGKKAFHSEGKRLLKLLAAEMGLQPADYNISSSLGGIAVPGDVILHTDHLYISVSQRCKHNHTAILYRTCSGRKDYCGHHNCYANITSLSPQNLPAFAVLLVAKVNQLNAKAA
jgi:hypothetical protein